MSKMSFSGVKGLVFVGLALLVTSSGFALDAEDWTTEKILDRLAEANGGRDALQAVSDLRMRGFVRTSDLTYDFLLLKKRPNKLRMHLMYKGRSVETGFNGIDAWQRVWSAGTDTVRKMSKEELRSSGVETSFDGSLTAADNPLVTRTFERIERIDRTDYFIVLHQEGNKRTSHYVDSRTFREWKTIREILDDNGEVTDTIETIFSKYRKYGTIWFAENVTRTSSDGTVEEITIIDIEINPGILDRAFAMPKQWSGIE
ncbi:hypothetical protein G0Q06_01070 [Puniceicoccales bacterium CK1056]|uniref:Outer membrane lipoprotein-sorting protein n=1 Tax=Oceanipulchritudo coccoides TaxID=2706888 RepID=A0A6B2LXM4_9BACT|nr:hypothetical protein [Oceanipulchritudo coccoides]NDV61033.1 hypothetical protein [Oceanipulchritudo coccoides]